MTARWLTLFTLASLAVGCVDPYGRPNYTGSGALIGGGSGALLGAAIDRRNPGAGALIGGAAGLVTGAIVGSAMDEDARRRRYYEQPPVYVPSPVYVAPPAPPAPAPVPVAAAPSTYDIKSMVRAGVSDDTIISQIITSRAIYQLDANGIIDLKNAGVSERVIQAMISTSSDVVVDQTPPPPQTETIVVSPGPDYYWCGGEWRWSGGAWIWLPGRWILRPYHGAVWVEARWVHSGRGWHREGGRWR